MDDGRYQHQSTARRRPHKVWNVIVVQEAPGRVVSFPPQEQITDSSLR
jgi:hypothetical protein